MGLCRRIIITTVLTILVIILILAIIGIAISLSYYKEVLSEDWAALDDDIAEVMKSNCVIIYPHESYKDFFVALHYKMRHPKLLENVKFLMSPYFYSILPYRNHIGAIKSTSIRKKNAGSVARIVDELSAQKIYQFVISPKGTIKEDARWRTGYWWIAKALGVDIVVLGLNYKEKKVEIAGMLTPSDNIDKDQDLLKRWVKSIPQK